MMTPGTCSRSWLNTSSIGPPVPSAFVQERPRMPSIVAEAARGCTPRGVGFVAVDFAGGGAGHHGGGLAIDHDPEVVVLADHGGGLAGEPMPSSVAETHLIRDGSAPLDLRRPGGGLR